MYGCVYACGCVYIKVHGVCGFMVVSICVCYICVKVYACVWGCVRCTVYIYICACVYTCVCVGSICMCVYECVIGYTCEFMGESVF